jgi:Tol biopolymer transport system component
VIPDDPIDDAYESIPDGRSVDWELTESKAASALEQSRVRALRDLERIAEYNRSLQRSTTKDQPSSSGATPPPPWGHLTPLELVSAGRSGEVWRSWDAWLQREVALKFLFAPDAGNLEDSALLAEARALARIRHPGVVAVHGIGYHDGRVGMWMEFLVGSTLEAEIQRRGPLPPRDATRIGLEVCRALEAVVAAGLVHRDIKPANIVLEPSGRTVLTDFGLGRRLALADRETWHSSGTPLFMAPELLAGEPATPRSDLYALGVTLRWALTGHSPFRAHTIDDLRVEAGAGPPTPLRSERPDVPAALADVIERAMSPRAEARYASAAQIAEDLERILSGANGVRGRTKWRTIAATGTILLLGAAILILPRFRGRPASIRAARFSVTAPPNTTLFLDANAAVVSPNGRFVAFVASDSAGTRRIWLRPLEVLTARPLEGTEDGDEPFWSPDSRSLGFFADMKLKTIAVFGGPPEVLCSAASPRGASWGKGGAIVFAPMATGSLYRVSSEGGTVTEILRPDSARQETAFRWPQFLPDGERFLFVALPPRNELFDVLTAALGSKERRHVMTAGCAPVCAGAMGLILASNGRLMLQGFDYRRLKPVGAPVALGRAPFSNVSVGQPLASASTNGVLVYLSESLANTNLAWVDRTGRRGGVLPLPAGRYERMYFAPDGRRLLAERRDSPTTVDLWMIDLVQGKSTRFSQGSQSRMGGAPAWSPDGRRIAFSSNRAGRTHIYQRFVDEAREETLLYGSTGQFKEVNEWSSDGRYLVFEQADPVTGWDLWLLPMDRKREPIPYLRSRFNEAAGRVSPDGKWLVYSSDATGKTEVYVRSFPQAGAEHPVSNSPGRGVWSSDGREILIEHTKDGRVWSVPVTTTPTFKAGTPRLLFRQRPGTLWLRSTPRGDRFLESTPITNNEPPSITVDLSLQPSGRR